LVLDNARYQKCAVVNTDFRGVQVTLKLNKIRRI
jgi:hypothetical protein